MSPQKTRLGLALRCASCHPHTTALGLKWYDLLGIYVVGTILFGIKKMFLGACEFTIDDTGVNRKSKNNEDFTVWSDIKEIHNLSGVHLIGVAKDFLPLPYRCFNLEEH